ncbi:type II/IV secretion system protein [Candidatus Parcubacteria bacterium]|nr:type II/IV secretion system protein [Candidatus Parcubacteria bacterium]
MTLPQPKTLLDALREAKAIDESTRKAIEREVTTTGRDLESVLGTTGNVPEPAILEAKSRLFNIPVRAVENVDDITQEALQTIPEEAARFYQLVPLEKRGQTLTVGIINPGDWRTQEALKFILARRSLKAQVYLISQHDFEEVLKRYRTLRGEVAQALEELESELSGDTVTLGERKHEPAVDEEVISEEAPITKVVAVILKHATEGNASDIHIEPGKRELRVRFRVDGALRTSLVLPLAIHQAVASRIKILSDLKIDETRIPQDGRFHARIGDKEIDFRVSTFPTSFGEKVEMRILDPSVGIRTLEELGVSGRNLEALNKGMNRPYGMILATGPTGSGKSTTLYAVLRVLNKEDVNIISLEDPVEYYIENLNQSQIRPEIGYTFATGLRHVLRQDPDIIMVGEIRDSETAELAIHAALTGHIVLSTLHTNDALGVIPRLVDMGIQPFLIPSALNLVLAQRLVRRLCPDCKRPYPAAAAAEKIILETVATLPESELKLIPTRTPPFTLYEAPGCKRCGHKGTRGRIAIYEVLEMTPQLEEITVHNLLESALVKEAERQGVVRMKHDGVIKALQGLVGLEEVLEAVEV